GGAPRGGGDARPVLRGAPAAGVARGRAHRVSIERAALLRVAPRPRPREGRAERRGRRRAVPRLPPLPRHPVERAAGPAVLAAGPRRRPRAHRPRGASAPGQARPLRAAELPGPAAGAALALLRELLGLPGRRPGRLAARPRPSRRPRSVRPGLLLLRRGAGGIARPDEPSRHAHLPGRAAHEAGPDEHGRVGREPRAVPRPRARRARGGHPGVAQAPRMADQGSAAGGPPRSRPAGHPVASQDGIPGAGGPMAPRGVLAPRRARRARPTRPPPRPVRSAGPRAAGRRAPVGRRRARRPAVAPAEPRAVAARVPRRRGPPVHGPGGLSAMRLLWVKVGGLWRPDRGGRLRSFHVIAELSRRHRVTVLTTHATAAEREGLRAALPGCEAVISVEHRLAKRGSAGFAAALVRSWLSPLPVDISQARLPAVRREADRLIAAGPVDSCIADFLAAIPNVPLAAPVPRVLFEHNVEHVIWRRLAAGEPRWWRRVLIELEWRKMRRFEAKA